MRNSFSAFFLIIVFVCCQGLLSHGAYAESPAPHYPSFTSKMGVSSYLLLDYDSELVLASSNPDMRLAPASVTKMLSMYVIDKEMQKQHISPEDQVFISTDAWKTAGTRMFLNPNTKVKVKDLIRGVIIQSGNDATVALAEHLAGNEAAFVALMNAYAKQLGMENSHFVNASGLPDPNQYVTARDLSKLAKALISEFPETYKIYAEKEYTFNNIRQYNRNGLLWSNEYVDGIKTGRTDEAGYCLVASAKKGQMRLIGVVMGAPSNAERTKYSNELLMWGFRFFETYKLYAAGTVLKTVPVKLGKQKLLDLGLEQNLYITIPGHQYEYLDAKIALEADMHAPIKAGDQLGYYVVQLHGRQVASVPLVAMADIEQGNWLVRCYDYLKIYAHKLLQKITG